MHMHNALFSLSLQPNITFYGRLTINTHLIINNANEKTNPLDAGRYPDQLFRHDAEQEVTDGDIENWRNPCIR